jgi:DNA-binding NarL/FixJ family response regulator
VTISNFGGFSPHPVARDRFIVEHEPRCSAAAGHRVLTLTDAASGTEAAFAIAAGAFGYVARPAQMAQLRDAIAQTRAGAEIAVLVAQGLSNREIAGRLVVSVRTVDSHLQRVFGKLNISRREELAALFDRDPAGARQGPRRHRS